MIKIDEKNQSLNIFLRKFLIRYIHLLNWIHKWFWCEFDTLYVFWEPWEPFSPLFLSFHCLVLIGSNHSTLLGYKRRALLPGRASSQNEISQPDKEFWEENQGLFELKLWNGLKANRSWRCGLKHANSVLQCPPRDSKWTTIIHCQIKTLASLSQPQDIIWSHSSFFSFSPALPWW